MQNQYSNQTIASLRDEFVAAGTREAILDYAERAERLISAVTPEGEYKVADIARHLAGRRVFPVVRNETVAGRQLLQDLRLMVEDLSDKVELEAAAIGEQVFTVEQLAKQFNVSTKTISRWRDLGLVSRRMVFDAASESGSCAAASTAS